MALLGFLLYSKAFMQKLKFEHRLHMAESKLNRLQLNKIRINTDRLTLIEFIN